MSNIELKIGHIRLLTDDEKERYPDYKYVVLSEFSYKEDDYEIIVPPLFLTDGSTKSPDIGYSWVFHDYLYNTHEFTSGQSCTRKQADEVMHKILVQEGYYVMDAIFRFLAGINFLGLFSYYWRRNGDIGIVLLDECTTSVD